MEKLPLSVFWLRTILVFLGECENDQQDAHFFWLIYCN